MNKGQNDGTTIPKSPESLPTISHADYPPEFKCEQFDGVVIGSDEDIQKVHNFIALVRKFVSVEYQNELRRPPELCTLDGRGPLTWKQSLFDRLHEGLERSTYIFFLMTKNFEGAVTKLFRDEALMKWIHDPNGRDTVIPLHTFAKNDRYDFYPRGIRALEGIDIQTLNHILESRDVSEVSRNDFGEHLIEKLQTTFNQRAFIKYGKEEKQRRKLTEWIKDGRIRRQVLQESPESDEAREERVWREMANMEIGAGARSRAAQSPENRQPQPPVGQVINISNSNVQIGARPKQIIYQTKDPSENQVQPGDDSTNTSYDIVEICETEPDSIECARTREDCANSTSDMQSEETSASLQTSPEVFHRDAKEITLDLPEYVTHPKDTTPLSYLGRTPISSQGETSQNHSNASPGSRDGRSNISPDESAHLSETGKGEVTQGAAESNKSNTKGTAVGCKRAASSESSSFDFICDDGDVDHG